jgi:hypothetical protein
MISNDAIHIQAEGGGEHGNVESIGFWKLMTTYVGCMMSSDMLNMFLLHINGHNQNKEHTNVANGMDGPLV